MTKLDAIMSSSLLLLLLLVMMTMVETANTGAEVARIIGGV